VLAVLAMLAPKWALRVAAGGSAPPIPPLCAASLLLSGRDGKAGALTERKAAPIQGCHVCFARCDISNGEKKCLFNRGATASVGAS